MTARELLTYLVEFSCFSFPIASWIDFSCSKMIGERKETRAYVVLTCLPPILSTYRICFCSLFTQKIFSIPVLLSYFKLNYVQPRNENWEVGVVFQQPRRPAAQPATPLTLSSPSVFSGVSFDGDVASKAWRAMVVRNAMCFLCGMVSVCLCLLPCCYCVLCWLSLRCFRLHHRSSLYGRLPMWFLYCVAHVKCFSNENIASDMF